MGRFLPRFALVLLALITAVSATVPVRADLAPGGTFRDDDGSFAEGAIEAIAAQGITSGCGEERFCPARPVTRAEAAVFLTQALGLEPPSGPTGFPDVPSDAWYASSLAAAAAGGVVTGHPDGTFRPDLALTRAEMAGMLARALGGETASPATSRFADVPAGAWYAGAVEWLAGRGITRGCEPAAYCPERPVRRDELAVFLTRALGLTPLVPPPRLAPLNGLPVDGLASDRRVVAVKIDNHPGALPQAGIQAADAVVEMLVEFGLTRWMALFHQSDIGFLGPVRSGRPTDVAAALPLGATLVASGGQPWILDELADQGVPILRERTAPPPALFRIGSRRAPHNLFADTAAVRKVAEAAGYPDRPPPHLFDWGELSPGMAAERIELSWSDPVSVVWTWDGTRYRRWWRGQPQTWVAGDGRYGQVTADTLVVLAAPVTQVAPPPGFTGSPVPVLETVGEGPAYVFAGGEMVEGTWSRQPGEWFVLSDSSGAPLSVPPGVPWINLFPRERPVLVDGIDRS